MERSLEQVPKGNQIGMEPTRLCQWMRQWERGKYGVYLTEARNDRRRTRYPAAILREVASPMTVCQLCCEIRTKREIGTPRIAAMLDLSYTNPQSGPGQSASASDAGDLTQVSTSKQGSNIRGNALATHAIK